MHAACGWLGTWMNPTKCQPRKLQKVGHSDAHHAFCLGACFLLFTMIGTTTGGRPTTGGISSLSVKAQCKAKRIELIEEAKMKLARLRATNHADNHCTNRPTDRPANETNQPTNGPTNHTTTIPILLYHVKFIVYDYLIDNTYFGL